MEYKSKDFKCAFCGEIHFSTVSHLFTNKHLCDKEECKKKAVDYEKEKDRIINEFANEKERILKPLKEKLEMDLFFNDRKFLYRG